MILGVPDQYGGVLPYMAADASEFKQLYKNFPLQDGYDYIFQVALITDLEDSTYPDMKKLAGETTHKIRPIQYWLRSPRTTPKDSPTPHGPIKNGYSFCLAIAHGQKPAIELGGKLDHPLLRPNVNIKKGIGVDIVHDLNELFPISSESYGYVFSRFVMEHIKNSRIEQFISECYRITKPGGVNIHIIPNARAQFAAMASLETWTRHDLNLVFAGNEDPKNPDPFEEYHHTGFSPELAVDDFKKAGFSEVVVWEYPVYHLEMIVEAWK